MNLDNIQKEIQERIKEIEGEIIIMFDETAREFAQEGFNLEHGDLDGDFLSDLYELMKQRIAIYKIGYKKGKIK